MDSGRALAFGPDDRDDVEPASLLEPGRVRLKKVEGGQGQPTLLLGGDRLGGRPLPAGFDLDEDQDVAVPGDQVDLTLGWSGIPGVRIRIQPPCGGGSGRPRVRRGPRAIDFAEGPNRIGFIARAAWVDLGDSDCAIGFSRPIPSDRSMSLSLRCSRSTFTPDDGGRPLSPAPECWRPPDETSLSVQAVGSSGLADTSPAWSATPWSSGPEWQPD